MFHSFLAVTSPSDEFIAVIWTECRSMTWTVLLCRMLFVDPSSPRTKVLLKVRREEMSFIPPTQ